jgi:hypothetical protein
MVYIVSCCISLLHFSLSKLPSAPNLLPQQLGKTQKGIPALQNLAWQICPYGSYMFRKQTSVMTRVTTVHGVVFLLCKILLEIFYLKKPVFVNFQKNSCPVFPPFYFAYFSKYPHRSSSGGFHVLISTVLRPSPCVYCFFPPFMIYLSDKAFANKSPNMEGFYVFI